MIVVSRGCFFRRLWVIKVDFSGFVCYWEYYNMSFWFLVFCSIIFLDLLGFKGNIYEFLLFFWICYDCCVIVIGCELGMEGIFYECCKNCRIWNFVMEFILRFSYLNVGRNFVGINLIVFVYKLYLNRIWIWNIELKCCFCRKFWLIIVNVWSFSNYFISWVCYMIEFVRD